MNSYCVKLGRFEDLECATMMSIIHTITSYVCASFSFFNCDSACALFYGSAQSLWCCGKAITYNSLLSAYSYPRSVIMDMVLNQGRSDGHALYLDSLLGKSQTNGSMTCSNLEVYLLHLVASKVVDPNWWFQTWIMESLMLILRYNTQLVLRFCVWLLIVHVFSYY